MGCTPSNPGMMTPCPTCPPGEPGRGIDRLEPVPGTPGVYNVIGTDGALLGTVTFPPGQAPDPGADGVGIDRVEQLPSGVVMVYGTDGSVLGSFVPPAGKDADPGEPGDQGPGFTSAVINSEGHLILTRTDGAPVDAGLIPIPRLSHDVTANGLAVCIGVGCNKECVTITWQEICDGLTTYGCFTAPPAPVAPTVTTPPVIESTETVGGTISVTTPAVFAGSPAPTVTCSWTLNGAPMPGETSCGQVLNAALGTWVLTATATNTAGTMVVPSNSCVVSAVAPTVTTPPVIESTETAGGTITVTTPAVFAGAPTPTVACSWTLNGTPMPGETSCGQVLNAVEGTWVLKATATNAGGTVTASSNSCVVSPVAPPSPCPTPTVVAFLSPNAYQVGVPYSGSILMQNTTAVTAVNGLPAGLVAGAFSAGNIPVSGTPTTEGSFSVTVNATNACGGGLTPTSVSGVPAGYGDVLPAVAPTCPTPTVTQELTQAATANCPTPTVSATLSPTTFTVGTAYTGSVTFTNATSATLSGLPPGLTAAALSGNSVSVTGTPTSAGSLPFPVTASVTNACSGGVATTVTGVLVGILVVPGSGGGGG